MGNARSIPISGSSFSLPWEKFYQSKGSWREKVLVGSGGDMKSLRRFEIVENKKGCGGLELVTAELGWPWISLFFFIKDLCLFKLVTMNL